MSTTPAIERQPESQPIMRDIPLSMIAPSPTNPRKTFSDSYIQELAASIKSTFQVQAGIVRWATARAEDVLLARVAGFSPAFGPGEEFYQIVVGECRSRACAAAGKETFRAEVRDLSDLEAQIIQNVENLHRKDLEPIEEAEGFANLIKAGLKLDEIAQRIDKSIQYVSARSKLTDLVGIGRKILSNGWLSAGHAILVARLDATFDQNRALCAVYDEGKEVDANIKVVDEIIFDLAKDAADNDLPIMSEKGLRQWIRDNVNLDLTKAPWQLDDPDLDEHAGACTVCPFRSGNNAALFGDLADGKNICMKPRCYNLKKQRIVQMYKTEGDYVSLSSKPSNEAPKQGATMLKAGQWVESNKGECSFTVEGLIVDGEQEGHRLHVCGDVNCKKHPHAIAGGTADASDKSEPGKAAGNAKRTEPDPFDPVKNEITRRKQEEKAASEQRVVRIVFGEILNSLTTFNDREFNLILRAMFSKRELMVLTEVFGWKPMETPEDINKAINGLKGLDLLKALFTAAHSDKLFVYSHGESSRPYLLDVAKAIGLKPTIARGAELIEEETKRQLAKRVCSVCGCTPDKPCVIEKTSYNASLCVFVRKDLCSKPKCIEADKKRDSKQSSPAPKDAAKEKAQADEKRALGQVKARVTPKPSAKPAVAAKPASKAPVKQPAKPAKKIAPAKPVKKPAPPKKSSPSKSGVKAKGKKR